MDGHPPVHAGDRTPPTGRLAADRSSAGKAHDEQAESTDHASAARRSRSCRVPTQPVDDLGGAGMRREDQVEDASDGAGARDGQPFVEAEPIEETAAMLIASAEASCSSERLAKRTKRRRRRSTTSRWHSVLRHGCPRAVDMPAAGPRGSAPDPASPRSAPSSRGVEPVRVRRDRQGPRPQRVVVGEDLREQCSGQAVGERLDGGHPHPVDRADELPVARV